MISAQTLCVCRERKSHHTFLDHALGPRRTRKRSRALPVVILLFDRRSAGITEVVCRNPIGFTCREGGDGRDHGDRKGDRPADAEIAGLTSPIVRPGNLALSKQGEVPHRQCVRGP